MVEHVFGGNWTEEKLETLKKYLVAYKSIFDNNPKAQYFTTWYVDAFAGTGSRSPSATLPGGLQVEMDIDDTDDEAAKFLDGSAKIALSIPSPFHKYLFIGTYRLDSLANFFWSNLSDGTLRDSILGVEPIEPVAHTPLHKQNAEWHLLFDAGQHNDLAHFELGLWPVFHFIPPRESSI